MGLHQSIKKILIVNRSEIASRIVRAAWSLGIKPVVVYTEEDAQAPYLYEAHEAYQLSQEGSQAYFAVEELLGIAKQACVDAIHPGYGFLSENSDFAQAVIDNGFYWIGPRPEIIRQMGNKRQARDLALQLGVSVIPGITLSIEENVSMILSKILQEVEFPVLVKDPLSGGGKGTKVALDEESFHGVWDSVKSYTKRTTKSPVLIIERYLSTTRHIEVQIAGDGKQVIHLYERDCTTQRRYQKIIEEAPSSFVAEDILQKLYDAALKLGRSVGYDSVGTVEFLVDDKGNWYFLEMNTRLQVEHAITEQITNIDLVVLQFMLAAGEKIPYAQDQITKQGYAIECRLYAEDPFQKFLPSTGSVAAFLLPEAPFIRIEHALYEGKAVSYHFDPMLAKIISWGKSRQEAITKMRYALKRFFILGLVTNQTYLTQIVESELFQKGLFDVKTFSQGEVIDRLVPASLSEQEKEMGEQAALVAAEIAKASEGCSREDGVAWKRMLWKQRNCI